MGCALGYRTGHRYGSGRSEGGLVGMDELLSSCSSLWGKPPPALGISNDLMELLSLSCPVLVGMMDSACIRRQLGWAQHRLVLGPARHA